MDITLADTETLLKIVGSALGICVIVGGWLFTLVRRQYDKTEAQFDAFEEEIRDQHAAEIRDMAREIRYLERRCRDLKDDKAELREDRQELKADLAMCLEDLRGMSR